MPRSSLTSTARRLAAATIPLLLLIAACGGTDTDTDTDTDGTAGEEAFRDASKVSNGQGTQGDLRPTFSACANLTEWEAANEKHPFVDPLIDPKDYARAQCRSVTEIVSTPVCTSLPPA